MTRKKRNVGEPIGNVSLANTIFEYKSHPHTSELINETWDTIWRIWGFLKMP